MIETSDFSEQLNYPRGSQELKDVLNFDYIKPDERMGGDGCKQGH